MLLHVRQPEEQKSSDVRGRNVGPAASGVRYIRLFKLHVRQVSFN